MVRRLLTAAFMAVLVGLVAGAGPTYRGGYYGNQGGTYQGGGSVGGGGVTPPSISGVAPPVAVADGDSFTVTGIGFEAAQGAGDVIVDNAEDVGSSDPQSQTEITWATNAITFVLNDAAGWADGESLWFRVDVDRGDSATSSPYRFFDEDPPDTVSFAAVGIDSSDTSDIGLIYVASATEPALWRATYKSGIAGAWAPADSAWHSDNTSDSDTTYTDKLRDTLSTGTGIAALTGDTIYPMFSLKDSFFVAHVSAYYETDYLIVEREEPIYTWYATGPGQGGWWWGGAFHPDYPGTVIVGADVSGIFRTTDGGDTWEPYNRGLSSTDNIRNHYVNQCVGVATDSFSGFVATTHGGVFTLADGDTSWTNVTPADSGWTYNTGSGNDYYTYPFCAVESDGGDFMLLGAGKVRPGAQATSTYDYGTYPNVCYHSYNDTISLWRWEFGQTPAQT